MSSPRVEITLLHSEVVDVSWKVFIDFDLHSRVSFKHNKIPLWGAKTKPNQCCLKDRTKISLLIVSNFLIILKIIKGIIRGLVNFNIKVKGFSFHTENFFHVSLSNVTSSQAKQMYLLTKNWITLLLPLIPFFFCMYR